MHRRRFNHGTGGKDSQQEMKAQSKHNKDMHDIHSPAVEIVQFGGHCGKRGSQREERRIGWMCGYFGLGATRDTGEVKYEVEIEVASRRRQTQ